MSRGMEAISEKDEDMKETPSREVDLVEGEFKELKLGEKGSPNDHVEWEECNGLEKKVTGGEKEEEKGKEGGEEWKGVEERWGFYYPQRPGEPDCAFYLKTGKCAYWKNCKFNHPPVTKKMLVDSVKEKGEEESQQKVVKLQCRYHLAPEGCKYGSACRYGHSQEKTEADPVELNFLGLPVRPGEKECSFYMRTGSCKFSTKCRFHHPSPAEVGGSYSHPGFHLSPASGVSQPSTASWDLERTSKESIPSVNVSQPYLPQKVAHHPAHANSDWNGSQQQQKQITEFPQRPGQPDCPYYLKSGDCKYRSACKFHHPKHPFCKPPTCLLSPLGLPLRPGQSICIHYRRYGICKLGPTCTYDHPMNQIPSQTMGS